MHHWLTPSRQLPSPLSHQRYVPSRVRVWNKHQASIQTVNSYLYDLGFFAVEPFCHWYDCEKLAMTVVQRNIQRLSDELPQGWESECKFKEQEAAKQNGHQCCKVDLKDFRTLLVSAGASETLASPAWVANAVRLIIWRLAQLAGQLPPGAAGLPCAPVVLDELKARCGNFPCVLPFKLIIEIKSEAEQCRRYQPA